MLLNKNVYEKHNPIVIGLEKGYMKLFNYTFRHKRMSLVVAIALLGGSLYIATFLGSEFLPHLDEGALWVKAQTPLGIALPNVICIGR